MRYAILLILLSGPVAAQDEQTRCGWYSNPTPANYEIEDADGVWILSVQGRGDVEGFYDAQSAAGGRTEWVAMSPAGYGFGCACVEGRFGSVATGQVLEIFSLTHLPLRQCASDPNLPDRDLRVMGE